MGAGQSSTRKHDLALQEETDHKKNLIQAIEKEIQVLLDGMEDDWKNQSNPTQNADIFKDGRALILVTGYQAAKCIEDATGLNSPNFNALVWRIPQETDNHPVTIDVIARSLQEALKGWQSFFPGLPFASWQQDVSTVLNGSPVPNKSKEKLLVDLIKKIEESKSLIIVAAHCSYSRNILEWLQGAIAISKDEVPLPRTLFVLGMEGEPVRGLAQNAFHQSQLEILNLCTGYKLDTVFPRVELNTTIDFSIDDERSSISAPDAEEKIKFDKNAYDEFKKNLIQNLNVWEHDKIVLESLYLIKYLRKNPTLFADAARENFALQEILLKYKTPRLNERVIEEALVFTQEPFFAQVSHDEQMQIYEQILPYVSIAELEKILAIIGSMHPMPKPYGAIARDAVYLERIRKITQIINRAVDLPQENYKENDHVLHRILNIAIARLALAGKMQVVAPLISQGLQDLLNKVVDEKAEPICYPALLTFVGLFHSVQIVGGRDQPTTTGDYTERTTVLTSLLEAIKKLYAKFAAIDLKLVIPAATYLKAISEVAGEIDQQYLDDLYALIQVEGGDLASQITLAGTAMDLARYVHRDNVHKWLAEVLRFSALAMKKGGNNFHKDYNSILSSAAHILKAYSLIRANPNIIVFGDKYVKTAWDVAIAGKTLAQVMKIINKYRVPGQKITAKKCRNIEELYNKRIKKLPQQEQLLLIAALDGNDSRAHLNVAMLELALTKHNGTAEAIFYASTFINEKVWEKRRGFRYKLLADIEVVLTAAVAKAETGSCPIRIQRYLSDISFGNRLNAFIGAEYFHQNIKKDLQYWEKVKQLDFECKLLLLALEYLNTGAAAGDDFFKRTFTVCFPNEEDDATEYSNSIIKNNHLILAKAYFFAARLTQNAENKKIWAQKAFSLYKEAGAAGMCTRMVEVFSGVALDKEQEKLKKKEKILRESAANKPNFLTSIADVLESSQSSFSSAKELTNKSLVSADVIKNFGNKVKAIERIAENLLPLVSKNISSTTKDKDANAIDKLTPEFFNNLLDDYIQESGFADSVKKIMVISHHRDGLYNQFTAKAQEAGRWQYTSTDGMADDQEVPTIVIREILPGQYHIPDLRKFGFSDDPFLNPRKKNVAQDKPFIIIKIKIDELNEQEQSAASKKPEFISIIIELKENAAVPIMHSPLDNQGLALLSIIAEKVLSNSKENKQQTDNALPDLKLWLSFLAVFVHQEQELVITKIIKHLSLVEDFNKNPHEVHDYLALDAIITFEWICFKFLVKKEGLKPAVDKLMDYSYQYAGIGGATGLSAFLHKAKAMENLMFLCLMKEWEFIAKSNDNQSKEDILTTIFRQSAGLNLNHNANYKFLLNIYKLTTGTALRLEVKEAIQRINPNFIDLRNPITNGSLEKNNNYTDIKREHEDLLAQGTFDAATEEIKGLLKEDKFNDYIKERKAAIPVQRSNTNVIKRNTRYEEGAEQEALLTQPSFDALRY